MAKKPEAATVTGRWPVAVYDKDGKRVNAGEPATVTKGKAEEFDQRFGRLDEPLPSPDPRRAVDPSSP